MDTRLLLVTISTGILIIAFLKKHSDITQDFKQHLTNVHLEHQKDMERVKDQLTNVHSEHRKEINNLKEHLTNAHSEHQKNMDYIKDCHTGYKQELEKLHYEIKNGSRNLLQDIKTLDMELYSSLGIVKCLPCSSEDTSCIPCNMTWKDCADVYRAGYKKSGVYRIKAGKLPYPVSVYCDSSHGGGWTVFQRRMVNRLVNFNRNWQGYKLGFGNLTGDFWLGNEIITAITSGEEIFQLRVDLKYSQNKKRYAEYDSFQVQPESENYKLLIGDYSGGALDNGQILSYHNGMEFSTPDRDNDKISSHNCASAHRGGWWYNKCFNINLNDGNNIPKHSEMKLRPKNFIDASN